MWRWAYDRLRHLGSATLTRTCIHAYTPLPIHISHEGATENYYVGGSYLAGEILNTILDMFMHYTNDTHTHSLTHSLVHMYTRMLTHTHVHTDLHFRWCTTVQKEREWKRRNGARDRGTKRVEDSSRQCTNRDRMEHFRQTQTSLRN